MKTIVISGINLVEGGTLTILKQCLAYLDQFVSVNKSYKVIAIVHKKELCYFDNIDYIEISRSKSNWLYRIYYEYIFFYQLSKKLKPFLWFSLHDITPNVKAERRAVYCHNITPFYKMNLVKIIYSYKVFLFTLFYQHIYAINLKRNNYIIVQQNWLRKAFSVKFHLDKSKVIVAYPNNESKLKMSSSNRKEIIFFYPSLSRPFKNFEVICEAVLNLQHRGVTNFRVVMTIDGTEDYYSCNIVKKYKLIENLFFVGRISYEEVMSYYSDSTCLLFPSMLESWGLPISEFKQFNRPMIIADLPYAHETASNSKQIAFFPPENSNILANLMLEVISNQLVSFDECPLLEIKPPFSQSWKEIFNLLLK